MLARNDQTVVQFTEQLREVSASLAAERVDLGGALAELAVALEQVRGFIKDNRNALKSNVDKLTGITKVLVDQRASLAEALDTAPNAVQNLSNAINPETGALEGRALLDWFHPGAMVACNVTPPAGPVTSLSQNCQELRPGTGGPPLLFQPMGEQYTSEGGG
jgi:ABC-type transporter Mla subunit MlaD